MVRRALVPLLVLGMLVLAPGGSALAKGHDRLYQGRTSQSNRRLLIATQQTDGGLVLEIAVFQVDLLCPGDEVVRYYVVIHSRHGTPLTGTSIDIDEVELYEAVHLHGRIGVHGASGTLNFSIPVFDQTQTPTVCTTGDLTWNAHRTDRGKLRLPTPAPGETRVRLGI